MNATMSGFTLSQMHPDPASKVAWVENQFQRALQATVTKRNRLYDSLEMYFGDQIPQLHRDKMLRAGREPVIHNLAQRKVSGLVGSLMRNNYNIGFSSIDGNKTSLVYALEDMLKVDQEWGDWDYNLAKLITYGLVYEGVMQLVVSDKISPLGNLWFEICQPGSVILDPGWTTDRSKDMRVCFKYSYLSPQQIMEYYPEKSDQIRDSVFRQLQMGTEYKEMNYESNKNADSAIGDLRRVVEYTYLESERVTEDIDISTGIVLPKSDDVNYLREYAQANNLNIDSIRSITHTQMACRVITTCAELLKEPLEDKPHRLQIGRLPFFPFSADRVAGDARGIIALIKDLQDTLNKRENNLNNIVENSANGAAAVDPAIVGGDPKLKKLIQDNWANPQFKFWTAEGALASGKSYFAQLPKTQPPNDVFTQIKSLYDEVDRLLPTNPAMEGKQESSGESGYLFQLKSMAVDIAQTLLQTNLTQSITEMGESYYLASKDVYSKVRRRFTDSKGNQIVINDIQSMPNGDLAIVNDISQLPTLRTVVRMAQDSPNSRFMRRMISLDLLKIIPASMPSLQLEVMAEALSTVEMDDDYKKRIEGALENLRNQTGLQSQAAGMQTQQQMQQIAGAMQPQQAQEPAQPAFSPTPPPNPMAALMARAAA